MKYVATAAVAATFTASAALAGGVAEPVYEAAPQVTYVAPAAAGWTGGYVGANLNYGNGKLTSSGTLASRLTTAGFPTTMKPDGASGAIRAGYDWQRGAGVFGLGAEYNFGKYKDSSVSTNTSLNGATLDTEIKNAATIFARAGYAMNDNLMAYGLLGYTWAKGTATVSGFPSESRDLDGGTIGLGAEYKLNSNWSTYGEYTYTDFGTVETSGDEMKASLGQVKLGLNYRF